MPSVSPVETAASPEPHATTGAPTPPAISADPIVNQVVALGRTDNRVQTHLKLLTHTFGARLTGSHALMLAERWCTDQFSSFGLHARVERWGEFPVGFDRGPKSGRIVGTDPIELDFTTMSWSPGVLGPVRGPALPHPATMAELQQLRPRLSGAWIVHAKRERRGAPNAKTVREAKRIEDALRSAGVAGHVVPAWDRSGQLVHTSGDPNVDWSALSSDVRVYLRGEQHTRLLARLDAGEAVELEFSIDNRFFRGPVPLHNVVADIPGSQWPDEYVIVGGHLDSWDGADGAVDNGTGVATTMEAARLLMAAGAKPKRTIRFMLWSGEEQGLLGSEAYVAQHPELMAKISAVLVHDGGTNYLSGLKVTPEMMADMEAVFAPVMKLDPEFPFELTRADSLLPFGSDHTPFINAGVPAFFWDQAGRSDYDHMHHTQFDTFDMAVPEYQKHSAMVAAIAAWNLANLDHLIDRTNSAPLGRRIIGIELDDNLVTSVAENSKAADAKWKVGDRIMSIDSQAVDTTRAIVRAVSTGGARKVVIIKRQGKDSETVLDWSDDPDEAERAHRRADRAKRFGEQPTVPQ